jgi:flagellar hook protein FlgE
MAGFSIPLSGLAAASDSLDVIANNLANLNTDGYKDESVNFASIFNQALGTSGNGDPIQIGDGVQASGTTSNFSNGNPNATGDTSNMALQGNGFFVVQGNGGAVQYTRDGDFTQNSAGQLVNQAGQTVMGFPVVNGVVQTAGQLAPINVTQPATVEATATTQFSMPVNLDATAANGSTFTSTVPMVDSLGNSLNVTITYTKTANNTWSYAATVPSADVQGGTGTTTTLATTGSGTLTFESSGNLTNATPAPTFTVPTLADGAAGGTVTWNLAGSGGSSLVTQEASTNSSGNVTQNGFAAGSLTGFSVEPNGTVTGTYSNGQNLALGQVAVATFNNNQGLQQVGNNNFQASTSSGSANIGVAGTGGAGTIIGGDVEESNVNLSTEFSNMIVAQQGYEANAKVLTTLDQVSQATLQVLS